MKTDIEKLIAELKRENTERFEQNTGLNSLERSISFHSYNLTRDFIKRLETILKNHSK